MPGRVQQHADMLLRLVVGEPGTEGDRVGYCRVEPWGAATMAVPGS